MARDYIFVDESGDPGNPFSIDSSGNKIPTGASLFYILTAICIDDKKLFLLEHEMMSVKNRFGYKKEIKSEEISLGLYKELLKLINTLGITIYYRLVDKTTYKGQFKVDGVPKLHNVFDEYNLARVVAFACVEHNLQNVDIVIDRTDRRRLDGKFDSFDSYLKSKVKKYLGKTKSVDISNITHVDSKYVNVMQMSDIVSGAIRDKFTGKNENLFEMISSQYLIIADGKYERIQNRKKQTK